MHNAAPLSPGLHIVATPIGNLRDITLRALDALRGADLLLCEDTRTTLRLCRHYDIAPKRMIAYHDHTSERERDSVLSELRGGSLSAALLSEAGTPLISDPGYKLVREARKAGVPVYAVPGASALASALCVAGLPTDRFFFAGFLPPKRQARLSLLRSYAPIPATLVFYESPRRLAEMLKDALEALGNRPAAVARELTKLYEEVIPGLLSEVAADVAARESVKGECVVLIGEREEGDVAPSDADARDAACAARLAELLPRMSVKDAVAVLRGETGLPAKALYALAVRTKEGKGC